VQRRGRKYARGNDNTVVAAANHNSAAEANAGLGDCNTAAAAADVVSSAIAEAGLGNNNTAISTASDASASQAGANGNGSTAIAAASHGRSEFDRSERWAHSCRSGPRRVGLGLVDRVWRPRFRGGRELCEHSRGDADV
jgi:hypothetical protein